MSGRLRNSNAVAYAASLVPGGPATRFLILCTPRSGSELLVDLLDQLPEVACKGEVLRDHVRWPLRLLRGRARMSAARGARVWGCKALAQHLLWYESTYGSASSVVRALVDDGWRIVHLRRENVLASALSALHAEQSGRFHLRDETEAPPEGAVDADPAMILAWVHSFDVHQQWLDDLLADLPHEVVTYEADLCRPEDQQAAADRLATALGTPTGPVVARLRPGRPDDLWDRVPDPDRLRALLLLTRFAHLVDQ
jgi:LPS sulfotransferase NodH